MKIRLSWHQTGDTIVFDAINQDVAVWFVEQSNRLGRNQYTVGDQVIDILQSRQDSATLIDQEIKYITTVNAALRTLKLPEFEQPNNYYDQAQLNHLHKDWAETRQKWPKLTELFYKIDRHLYEAYQEMNCHIHLIERSFKYRFRDSTHWRASNPFQDTFYDWQVCHLYIEYPGHGRNAFEKFECLDVGEDLHRDNCNWDNIDSFIGVNLMRPYQISPPAEFLQWCEQEKLVPWQHTLPLANLSDWRQTLPQARRIFTKNVTISNNPFSLAIHN